MLGFLKTRRGLAAGAAIVIGGIVALLAGVAHLGRPLPGDRPSSESASQTAAPDANARTAAALPPVSTSTRPPPALPPAGGAETTGPASEAPAPADAAVTSGKPSFDVVRVEPGGDSVIAARGAPNADVVLLDGDAPIARAKTDANGQVALMPPTLKPGDHSLTLSITSAGKQDALSSQSVVVSVPSRGDAAPMVAMLQPDKPATILSGPVAGTAKGNTKTNPPPETASPPSAPMAIRSVEVEDMGSFYATGKATPGRPCRIYLNGSFVATVTPDGNGIWSLQIKRGMKPGRYAVRVDQVEAGSGKVVARAEVPFDYPRAAASLRKGQTSRRREIVMGTAPVPATGPIAKAEVPSPQGVTPQAVPAVTAAAKPLPAKPLPAEPMPAKPAARSDQVASASPMPMPPPAADAETPADGTPAPTGSAVVVADLVTAKVTHGDSLWRISRKMLGHGIRYTQIYAANTDQIRDPRLIYPGQVFVMPQTERP